MEIFLFVLGTTFASFLNALMYRIEMGFPTKKMLLTRSQCESCEKELHWYELIPILSWIFLKGRCMVCHEKISIYYPISELLLGISFVIVYSQFANPLISLFFLLILFSLASFDYMTKEIPQTLTNVLVGLGVVYFFYSHNSPTSLILLLGMVIFYFLIGLVKKEWKNALGFGDLLILIFFALVFPLNLFIATVIGFTYIAGIFSILMIIMKKGTIKSYIPLLPFMALSYALAPILSNILDKYIF